MNKYSRHPNQYSQSDFRPLYLMLGIMAIGAYLNYRFQPLQATLSPCPDTGCVMFQASKVEAVEPIKEPQTIEEYIAYKFGDKAEDALKIARCESQRDGKIQPYLVGDTHLTFEYNGETLGDSVGVYQIRTGGKEKSGKVWNRAKANGMTADEFRAKLKDWKYNIDYAKNVYDNAKGFSPWYNCMIKEGV